MNPARFDRKPSLYRFATTMAINLSPELEPYEKALTRLLHSFQIASDLNLANYPIWEYSGGHRFPAVLAVYGSREDLEHIVGRLPSF